MSEATSTTEEITTPFRNNIKGVMIVNDSGYSEYYGAIFHNSSKPGDSGPCTKPIVSTKDISCTTVDISVFSADIFTWNQDSPDSSGNGITFYNEPYGWNADVQSGSVTIYEELLKTNGIFEKKADKIEYDYTDVKSDTADACNTYTISCKGDYEFESDESEDAAAGMCCPCPKFKDCPGSIEILGSYLVAVYGYNVGMEGKSTLFCQTFTQDVPTLNTSGYAEDQGYIDYVNIIPIWSN